MRQDLFAFAQHKFASNVVEKCLQFGGTENRTQMIDEIIAGGSGGGGCGGGGAAAAAGKDSGGGSGGSGSGGGSSGGNGQSSLMVMIRDQYANYVIQKVRIVVVVNTRPHT